ncbi:uncharacterized protein [Littorina saxatilis]|uniref:uncharacterized protein isoform X2 n=1 Tax=Littorina saxatilis TaxID=31220 RepID=UPI0038B69701
MSHLLEQITPRKDSALGAGPSNKPRTESNKSSVACVEGVSGLGTSQSLSSVDTATLTLPTPAALAGVSDPLLLRHPVCTRVTPVNSSMKRIQNSRGKPPAVLSPRPQNNTRIGRRTRNQTDRMSKFLATVRRKRKASNQVPDKAQDTSEAGSPLKLETKTVPAKRVKTVRGLSRKLAVENLLQNSVQSMTKCTVVLQQLALEERASSSTSSVHKPERASQSFAQKKCTPVSASRVSVQKQCAPQCEPDTTVADCVQEQSTSDGVAGVAMQEKTSADVASWICVERQTAPESTRVAMQEETSADVASLVSVERQTAPESMSHLLEQITPRKDSALGAGPSNKPRTESNKSSVACVEGVSGLGTSQSLSSVDTATLTLPTPAALAGVSDPLLVSTRVTPVNSSMKRIRNSRGKPPAVLSPRPQNNTRIGRRTRNQTDRMSKFLATVRRKRKASNQVPDKAQDTSEAGSPLKLETKTVPAKRVKTVRGLSRKLAVENLLQNSEPDSDVEKKEYAIATVSNLVQEISTTASEVRQRNSNPASSMEKKVSENVQISVSRRKEIKDSSAFSPGEMGWRTIPESLNGMMSICVDDSDFQSAICTVMSVRTSSPSVEMVKHLVTVIKKADKVNLVDQGLAVLNAWLDKYPPVTPGLRTVYEKGLALDSWETFRTILQDAVCEAEVEEDLDDSKSASGPRARLILRTVVKALEKNFHQFMQNASRQGRIQCLVIRSLWSPSYQVYPNGRTRDLLLFLETALKHLDTPQSCWQELVKLVSMATQCCHLVDNNWQYSAGGLVDRCSSAMVRDLTQAISGGGISSSRQLQQVLSCVSPPWLLRQVSAVMLEEYDDYLVPGGLTSGPVTLQSIVSKFFFLLPKLSAQSKSVNVSPRKKVKKEDGVKDENKAPPAGLTADKINKKNHKGETMLHRAAIKNNISLLKQLLSVPGVDVNAQDYAGWTPLHEACNHGNTECARALLKFVPCATLHSFVQSALPSSVGCLLRDTASCRRGNRDRT